MVDRLLASGEPSIRWKVRVRTLIEGHARRRRSTYAKWQGGHWVLLAPAELGYPECDRVLEPLRDRVPRTWLDERYRRDYDPATTPSDRGLAGVPVVNGRHRRCASQHGAALLSVVRLGLADERAGAPCAAADRATP